MPNKEGYYQKYYEDNKDDINDKRRRRYESDEDYRSRVLKHSQTYRDKKRKEPGVRMPRYSQVKEYDTGDGGTIHLFSVGAFATFVQRSVQSISHWEKQGLIPKTPFRDSRGHRLYTRTMIESVKEEIGSKRRLFPADPEMATRVHAAWVDSGIPVGIEGDLDYVLAKTRGASEPDDLE